MNASPNNRMLAISQKIYTRLLVAYPRAHREAYGAAMIQLFRDQSRDAWKESGNLGLAKLWLRVLPDLARTSLLERLSNFNPHKTMVDKIGGLFRGPSPTSTFFTVATVVFLLTLGASIIITLLLPNTYASTTRIKVVPDTNLADRGDSGRTSYDPYFIQTTFEIMESEAVLSNVIATLDLNEKWGDKFNHGAALQTEQTMRLLKNCMMLMPVRNSMLISVTVYSDDPKEAAQIANAVAVSYQDYRALGLAELTRQGITAMQEFNEQTEAEIEKTQAKMNAMGEQLKIGSQLSPNPTPEKQAYWEVQRELDQMLRTQNYWSLKIEAEKLKAEAPKTSMVQIIDVAEPGRAPVKPNKPVNILIGVIGGGFLGLLIGSMAMVGSLQFRKAKPA